LNHFVHPCDLKDLETIVMGMTALRVLRMNRIPPTGLPFLRKTRLEVWEVAPRGLDFASQLATFLQQCPDTLQGLHVWVAADDYSQCVDSDTSDLFQYTNVIQKEQKRLGSKFQIVCASYAYQFRYILAFFSPSS
jgi:hypothetical protein